ncbi:MAG: DivIVA domain-containing protein [Anaerolineaceae bacterium]|nr:MAG: DivIVA domain-containing protein [Anaerolineaceae bacterium]
MILYLSVDTGNLSTQEQVSRLRREDSPSKYYFIIRRRSKLMLTPSEIRERTYKSGLGYDKKDVEQFIQEISDDFEQLLKENESLNKKVKDLTDSISYYKSIEKTLQKALVIAEKTAEDIKNNAHKEAKAIGLDAKANAKMIESHALKQSEMLEHKTLNLLKQYDLFKAHYKNLLNAQLELLSSGSFQINTLDFSYKESLVTQPESFRIDKTEEEINSEYGLHDDEIDKKKLNNTDKASQDNENAFEFIAIDDEEF